MAGTAECTVNCHDAYKGYNMNKTIPNSDTDVIRILSDCCRLIQVQIKKWYYFMYLLAFSFVLVSIFVVAFECQTKYFTSSNEQNERVRYFVQHEKQSKNIICCVYQYIKQAHNACAVSDDNCIDVRLITQCIEQLVLLTTLYKVTVYLTLFWFAMASNDYEPEFNSGKVCKKYIQCLSLSPPPPL